MDDFVRRVVDLSTKVIFLDIDGPMIPGRANYLAGQGKLLWKFDPVAVGMLLDVLKSTEAKLVISSMWGLKGKEIVFPLLEDNGISISYVHDDWITPRSSKKRANQIYKWLFDHQEIKRYAVIDDENMTKEFGVNMVLVTFEDGMLSKHHNQLLQLLGVVEE